MKKLKDISKKQWGLISTSIGSFLIIVGLLAMVGIGGTYAAAVIPDIGNQAGGTSSSSKPPSSSSSPSSSKPSSSPSSSSCVSKIIACEPGEYYTGSGSCSTCPANYYCPGTSADKCSLSIKGKLACSYGTISSPGSKFSTDCKSTITCAPGTYSPGQGSACEACEAGYYCPGVTASIGDSSRNGITACPSGTTSSAGAKSQSDCKSTSSTITCAAGTYAPGQGSACATCLAGYYCPGVTASAGDNSRSGIYACPTNATCAAGVSTFTCNTGYTKSGNTCVKKNSGGDSGNPGGGSGNPGGGSGNPGGDSGNSSGNSGNPDGGSGNPDGGSEDTYSVVLAYYYYEKNTTWKYYDKRAEKVTKGASFTPYNIAPPEGYYANNVYQFYDCTHGGTNAPYLGSGKVGVDSFVVNQTTCVNVQFVPINGQGSTDNNSNVNNNPSTATKAPLIIALMGVMSLAFGVFTYWKNRKVTDM